ncbi:MAG: prepilin-type N-terminal cleavage/methylation domain-containing protein [Desulfosalsimonadaceae bacterium]
MTGVIAEEKGFTLLEILVAIFIFAVVMTTIYASFNAVVSKNEAVRQGRGLYDMGRNCLERMAEDFSAIYVEQPPLYEPPDYNDPDDPYRFVAEEEIEASETFSRVRFAADAHLPMGGETEDGLAEIVYYVEKSGQEQSGFVLRRSDTVFAYDAEEFRDEQAADPVVCKNVQKFSLIFLDKDGEETSDWDSGENMGKYATPRAVKIELELAEGAAARAFHTAVTIPVYREKIESGRQGP